MQALITLIAVIGLIGCGGGGYGGGYSTYVAPAPMIPNTYQPVPILPGQAQTSVTQPSDYGSGTIGTPAVSIGALRANRYDPNSLANPYGAGSPYKPDGLMNPYSQYGSPYSNKSWRNPYATDAPKLYDQQGNYRGKLSTNQYDADSTSNPYGRYGSKYSPDSINNPYGAGNPYLHQPINVVPSP
jgi:hypothetical protein